MRELPDNPSYLLAGAVRMFQTGHYRTATCLSRIELLRNPTGYFALCWYAKCLHWLGKQHDHEAASRYERAIDVNPSLPLAHTGLGVIHYDNACRIAREYAMFPGGASVMFADESIPDKFSLAAGFADHECGNRRVAIQELEEAARLTNDHDEKVELLRMAAEMHCLMSNTAGIKAYKKVLALSPNDISARFDIAGCHAAKRDEEKALQGYEWIQANAPELASDLAAVLAEWGIETSE